MTDTPEERRTKMLLTWGDFGTSMADVFRVNCAGIPPEEIDFRASLDSMASVWCYRDIPEAHARFGLGGDPEFDLLAIKTVVNAFGHRLNTTSGSGSGRA